MFGCMLWGVGGGAGGQMALPLILIAKNKQNDDLFLVL